jgi:choice-of-anchor A domain-containing protein
VTKIIRTLTRGLGTSTRNWAVLAMVGVGLGVWAGAAQIFKPRALNEPDCIQVRLSDYNVFLLEDYHQGTDVQGKVAAGGHITLGHFSVGAGLPDSNTSGVLVAGGNLSLSNGGVHGDAWYGGNLISDASVTFSRGTASQGTPIDFAAREAELRGLSSRLASLPVNGATTRESWGGVMLRGTDPQLNVFDMDASIFTGAVLLSIDAPAGSLAVLNIHGASATFTGFGHSFRGGIDQRGVLFHFVEATAINAQGYGFWGTVLAPNAHLSFSNGSFDGGIYARALTGNAEGHLNPLIDRDICLSGPPPNNRPIVALTSPVDGASFPAPAALHLTASSTDSDGSITRVDFFSNGTLLGSDTSSPYTWDVPNVAAGTYALIAQATDDDGATATSATVTVTVTAEPSNTPPTVVLVSPANGASFTAPARIRLAASASDSDGSIDRVEFLRDGAVVATSSAPPYAATLPDVEAGSYTFTARATDNLGAVSSSAPTAVIVNALGLTITSPAPHAAVTGDNVLVTGTLQAPEGSGVIVNGVMAAIDASNTFYALVPLVQGANRLEATLRAPAGQSISQSITVIAAGQPSILAVSADTTSGFAPLTVRFSVRNRSSGALSFTFDGFGPFQLPGNATVALSRTYPAGVYRPLIVATAPGGGTSQQSLVIEVLDREEVDLQLRAMWAEMNNALVAGDKATAMGYLNAGARDKYGPVFDTLLPAMPRIIASYSPLQQVSLSPALGEYGVNRMINGVNRVFLIYFLRDPSGVWHVDAM